MEYKEAFEIIKKFTKLIADVPVATLRQRSELIKDLEVVERALEDYSGIKTKIENGTLIELPCKVGDKIYYISCAKQICEAIVEPHGSMFYGSVMYLDGKPLLGSWFNSRDIGKEFFLTKEQAEEKLKELKSKE